uniref:GATA-type domain-containing protein n=1 Tax=Meloidogyne incognita TaxID=6306 RepID=A0A914NHT1_MELIC
MNSLNENKNFIKEKIENYKDKLLSSYWTEINLIGYKIELLEKRKVEYLKELKSKIIDIGNKISEVNEGNLRNCFNCGAKQSKQWYKYLKEQFLCHVCGEYKRNSGKLRPKEMWFKIKKV